MADRKSDGLVAARRLDIAIVLPAALGLLLIVLIAAGERGLPAPLALLRVALGVVFILFVPGYALQAAIFPRTGRTRSAQGPKVDWVERLALSLGLSFAVIALLALMLDLLPWGIRLWPIVIAEGLFIAVCSAIAWFRGRGVPVEPQLQPAAALNVRGWWAGQARSSRIIYLILGVALALASIAALSMFWTPRPAAQFTEFYALGPEGLAQSYPREAAVGEEISVTLGIRNLERGARTYRVEVWAVDPWTEGRRQLVASDRPFELAVDESREWPISWRMPWAGDDQVVELLLFDEGGTEPYRSLRLWLNVVE